MKLFSTRYCQNLERDGCPLYAKFEIKEENGYFQVSLVLPPNASIRDKVEVSIF